MNKLSLLLEEIICDICFTGISDCSIDITERLSAAASLCRELDMKLGETLVCELSDNISEGRSSDAAKNISMISCYIQLLRSMSEK